MPSFASISANLLNSAADLFMDIARHNPDILEAMTENAEIYRMVAREVEADPHKMVGDGTSAALAVKLLEEAATFLRSFGAQNPNVSDQMADSAKTYDEMAALLASDPDGFVPDA